MEAGENAKTELRICRTYAGECEKCPLGNHCSPYDDNENPDEKHFCIIEQWAKAKPTSLTSFCRG